MTYILVNKECAMTKDYSAESLGEFFDWAIQKGLMKQETAKGRKIAALKVLRALDESEREDVRTVDRDAAFDRFVNKFGREFTPQSLNAYRSRFLSAVDEFIRYKDSPTTFKFETEQRKAKTAKGEESVERSATARKPLARAVGAPAHPPAPAAHEIVFPIPIREGVVVRVHNLPNNLTKTEASRIAAVITALAVNE